MSNLLKSKFLLGVMIVAVMFVGFGALTASAQQPVVSASDIQFAATVMSGSSGQASLIWQKFLNGYSSANLVADGQFGPLSGAALKVWQASRNLGADGVAGPMSRASAVAQINSGVTAPVGGTFPAGCSSASGFSVTTGMPCNSGGSLPAGCSSTAGYSPTTGVKCDSSTGGSPSTSGPLMGGAGSIDSFDEIAQYSSEEVGEDEEDVVIAGIEIENSDESDIELTAVRLDFDVQPGNDDLDEFITEVSIWLDGEEVARVDADDFNDDNDWTRTVSLDSGAIIRMGDTAELTVAVTGVSNVDSGDAGDDWGLDFVSVRYEDAQGAVITDNTTTSSFAWDVVDFATATDAELILSLSDEDDINEAHVIDVHATSDTDNVEILAFDLEAEGDSDIEVKDLAVLFTSSAGLVLTDGVSSVSLWMDGEEIATENMTAANGTAQTETITFDDLDFTIDAGDTVTITVSADLKSILDGIADGDTLRAQITATERGLFDVEDESGEELTDGTDVTGTASGDAHGLFDNGIMVEFVSSSFVKNSSDTVGINETVEFSLVFDVTAFGDDIWVEDTCIVGTTGTDVDAVEVSLDGDTNGDNTTCTDVTSTGDQGTNWEILEGQTERFTVTVLGNGGEAGAAGSPATFTARLNGIGYNVGTDAVGDTVYAFDLTNFKSSAVTVYDR